MCPIKNKFLTYVEYKMPEMYGLMCCFEIIAFIKSFIYPKIVQINIFE